MCRKNRNPLIYIAIAAALGILLRGILPTGFLVFILCVLIIAVGAVILFN